VVRARWSAVSIAELVAGKVVEVIIVLGEIDPRMEVIPKSLAKAVVIGPAGALQIALAPEAQDQSPAAITVALAIGVIVLVRLLSHLHVVSPPSVRGFIIHSSYQSS